MRQKKNLVISDLCSDSDVNKKKARSNCMYAGVYVYLVYFVLLISHFVLSCGFNAT